MKKVTIQDISNSLNISRITIWKVLNNKDGVSQSTREKVIKKAVELKYKNIDSNLVNSFLISKKPTNNISVIVSRPESTSFWVRIINQIANELGQNKFNLIYNPLTEYEEKNFKLPDVIKNGDVSGIIVINIYNEFAVKQLCNTKIPKVFLDIPLSMKPQDIEGDVILLEGVNSIFRITDNIIKKGCKRLGFIGDITYCQTIYDRFQGFVKAIDTNNLTLDEKCCFTSSIPSDLYKNKIEKFLNGIEQMPEAFICGNDYISFILLSCLHDRNLNVPNDIIISGYDDNSELILDDTFLTTVHVQNELLGKRLVKQLMYRLENPQSDYETIYINSKVIFRKSA